MPLNYSKWDQLELSDDSDIEGHPNVDKKSLIRWKQRDIHEKREQRKHHIASLRAEIACNDVIFPRIKEIATTLTTPSAFSSLVEQLQTNPSPDAPPTNVPGQPTYDAMVLSLLLQVGEEAKKKLAESNEGGEERLMAELKKGIEFHIQKLGEHQEKLRKDLVDEEKEQKKHITSDDMHDGFVNKYVPPKPEPPPVSGVKADKAKSKTKVKTTEFETIHSGASSSTAPSTSKVDADDDDDEDTLPTLTDSLKAFSQLPLWGYETSWKFIQSHRDVVVEGASDALLVEAFRAQGAGEADLAKKCVHQSLLLQYCDKLGVDGVRVFFQKMVRGDPRAEAVFKNDVENTYTHLCTRVAVTAAEEAAQGSAEQIQLVPENPSQSISFNVPDGPPPEDLVLEGPGTEGLDLEEVRKALQMRWDVFENFSEDLKKALKEGTLEGVNKVLGNMAVPEAEEVVGLLDVAGILSFAEGGIRDQTSGAKEDELEDDAADDVV